jgi:hypothetical protein
VRERSNKKEKKFKKRDRIYNYQTVLRVLLIHIRTLNTRRKEEKGSRLGKNISLEKLLLLEARK